MSIAAVSHHGLSLHQNFPAGVPFVIVLSFPGLIVKLISDFQKLNSAEDFRKQNFYVSLTLSSSLRAGHWRDTDYKVKQVWQTQNQCKKF